jgi:hypothetical protein
MADPYSVGIALALDNGVSEGLASICQDLGTLNRAIDNSATGLKQLGHIADQMKVGSIPRQVAPDVPWSPMSLSDSAHPRGTSLSTPDGASLAHNEGLVSPFKQLGADTRGDLSTPPRSRATSPSATALGSELGHSFAVSPVAPSEVVSGVGDARFDPEALSPARVLDKVQTWLSRSDPPSSHVTMGSIPSERMDQLANFPPAVESSSLRQLAASTDSGGVARAQFPHALAAPSAPHSPARQTTGFEAARSPSPATQPASTFPVPPSSVPPPAEPRGAALQGDVYLDGTLLGRWVVDHLTRSMDRPRAGITGFDPRLTATWPGAPIGT